MGLRYNHVTAADTWQRFRNNTTAHGIPHVDRATGKIKRLIWSILFMAILAGLGINLTYITSDFLRYRVVVNIQLEQRSHLEFPAVTVCNMNPVRKSAIANSTTFQEALVTQKKKRKKRSLYEECESGWVSHGSSCYLFKSTTADWIPRASAEADCDNNGAYLVSINNQAEQDFIHPITSPSGFSHWIGLSTTGYEWVDGSPSTFSNWKFGYPGVGDCVRFASMTATAKFVTDSCLVTHRYICKKTGVCPSPWQDINGDCLKISTVSKTYSEASDDCVSDGGQLASFDTQTQADDVLSNGESSETYWIGYRRTWIWADGTTLGDSDYTNWREFYPEEDDSVRIRAEGVWQTIPSTDSRRYVCEKSATEITTESPTTETATTETTTAELPTTNTPTTESPTTQRPTTETITTKTPTTEMLTTEGPTTEMPTTQTTTTEFPTTETLTTESPTSETPTTEKPTTEVPTTETTTTESSTTEMPTTEITTTEISTTEMPTTETTTTTETPTTETTTESLTTETFTTETIITKGLSEAPLTTFSPTTDSATDKQSTEQLTTASRRTTIQLEVSTAQPSAKGTTAHLAQLSSSSECSSCMSNCLPTDSSYAVTQTHSYMTTPPVSTTTSKPQEPQPVPGSKYPDRLETRESFQEEIKVTEVLSELDLEEKVSLGYSASDLILDCQFAGHDCFIRDFAEFYNAVHGNCFVFNSGWNLSETIMTSQRTGRRYGLHLTLNIIQDEYIEQTGDTAGVRLVVHPQWRMPFPEDEGVSVSPGHVTAIGMKQVVVARKSDPYGDCLEATIDPENNVYAEMYPVLYSTTACQKTCYQRHVIQRCKCADANYPLTGKAFGDVNVSICHVSNVEQGDCIYEIEQKFRTNSLACECPTSCTDHLYELEISEAQWPADVRKDQLLNNLKDKIGNLFDDPNDQEKYKRNLVKVELFFEEFNYERVTEKPRYPVWNFLSDCGGTLGLWLGCSVITLFEFFELLSDMLILSCCRILGCSNGGGSKKRISGSEGDDRRSSDLEVRSVSRGPLESVRSLSGVVLPNTPTLGTARGREVLLPKNPFHLV